MNNNLLLDYTLHLADNVLIHGQRLCEWCGHGPVLEQDIALSNIALDNLGQARNLLQFAALTAGAPHTEDSLAFMRESNEYKNLLLVELPNGDWGKTITKLFFFETFNYFYYQLLLKSNEPTLAAIAEKSLKEITYHLRYSAEWMIRLGDGTEVSHQKMQKAVNELWSFTGELFLPTTTETQAEKIGMGVSLQEVKELWHEKVIAVLNEATIAIPTEPQFQRGGKNGIHTEHFGFLLAEMQHMQRAYPNMEW